MLCRCQKHSLHGPAIFSSVLAVFRQCGVAFEVNLSPLVLVLSLLGAFECFPYIALVPNLKYLKAPKVFLLDIDFIIMYIQRMGGKNGNYLLTNWP